MSISPVYDNLCLDGRTPWRDSLTRNQVLTFIAMGLGFAGVITAIGAVLAVIVLKGALLPESSKN